MKSRCSEWYWETKPSYTGCSMCDEWKYDKYSFYEWVNDGQFYNVKDEKTVHLDKDILVKGNKIYSPETCIFVPARINDFFGGTARKNPELPIGVTQVDDKYKCTIRGVKDIFDTPEEAWECWRQHKEAQKIALADEYYAARKIPKRLYEAMLNYKFEITD